MDHFAAEKGRDDIFSLNTALLSTKELSIGYHPRGRSALVLAKGLNLAIRPGEMVCLVGPNGVGKSTLLRTLTRLQQPLSGEINLEGRPLKAYSDRQLANIVSVVLTVPVQTGAMRVEELVGLGRFPFTGTFSGLKPQDHQAIVEALRLVGALPLMGHFVYELSDGERQRIMIARALAQEPRLLILDEPTAFLDVPGRVSVMSLLVGLAHEHGKGVLTSTHDLDLALRIADRVWLMGQEGSIMEGAPEDLVISGRFGLAFDRPNVRFDETSGDFRLDEQASGSVILRAEGLAWIWTKRALNRAGFNVQEAGSSQNALVTAVGQGKQTRWRLEKAGIITEHESIYSLLMALNDNNLTAGEEQYSEQFTREKDDCHDKNEHGHPN